MNTSLCTFCLIAAAMVICFAASVGADSLSNLPIINDEPVIGFGNAGWAFDHYPELERLDAKACITVADIKGPGVITHIHTTRHGQPEISSRGVVLLIYFDGESEPAVQCPLADFFGDGCNGKSMDFTTPFIECAPISYNAYIPMPFKISAKVMLRNDTDVNLTNYSYVEWESISDWKPQLGYFHATYHREAFQLTKEISQRFFHVEGKGHLLGRQFSLASDEPAFNRFTFIMEGNNEVDIDGHERQMDYLGTEDSFTFSWGFQRTFAGYRAGMPFVRPDTPPYLLSIYRFHDYMPIHFNKELTWTINWQYDLRNPDVDKTLQERKEKDGVWVDYASVFYWYQNHPAGFTHQPLAPVAERTKDLLKTSLHEPAEPAKD